MTLPRCLVPFFGLLAATVVCAQDIPPAQPSSASALSSAAVLTDERVARLAERYKAMLAANPAEGLALDRLWKAYADASATGSLVEEFHRAAEAPKADAATVLVYGHLLKMAGRLDEAAAAYDKAAAISPDSPLPTLGRAEIALARHQPGDAAREFEAALARMRLDDRRRRDLLLKTGDAWQSAGQPQKAADAWEKTIALTPGDLAMHRRLTDSYEKNGMSERAIGHYKYIEAHADPAGRAAALRELARLHEARDEFDATRDSLERGLALLSHENWLYSDLQKRLILLYQRAGRAPELQARWQKAVDQTPRDLGGFLRLEMLAEAQGDPAAERVWLEKIVALSPSDRDSTLRLARLIADAGEREAATSWYDKLLQSQPGNLDLTLARADLDVQMGNTEAAVSRLEALIARSPTDESVTTAALVFFLERHLDAASEKLLRAQAVRHPTAVEPALALAKFLLSKRQMEAARHVFDELAAQPGDAAARAARWMAIAGAYKERNLADDALRAWREAAVLQPGTTAPLVAEAESLLAQGDAKGAVVPLKRALNVAASGPESVDIEHQLFQALQASAAAPGVDGSDDISRWARAVAAGVTSAKSLGLTIGRPGTGGNVAGVGTRPDTPLGLYLTELGELADDQPTVDHLLRLARWQQWAGGTDAAISALQKAVALDPKGLPARDLLVSIATEAHRRDIAEDGLREIIALDPTRQAEALRRLAALKLEDNDRDAAIEIFGKLQADAPGSVETLSNLAQVEQRTDRWYDALAHWEQAYALPGLTPAKRADLRRPLLAAYERLDQFSRAAETLQAAVDTQPDLPTRADLFRELVGFCRKHDLGGWLLKQYQSRHAAQPNDYFTLTALAELSKDAGQDREAYRLLERAYYSSPDPAASLHTLADTAETLGENDAAIAHQRHLLALPGQATAENLARVAELQSANLDAEAAARTWEQLIARFPRDPISLERAARFFENERKPGRARELFRQVIALDANNPRRLSHLARLDIETGDTTEARQLFGQLLDRTDPEKAGDPFLSPPELEYSPGTVSSLVAGRAGPGVRDPGLLLPTSPTEPDDRHLRLDAIRELSRLLLTDGSESDRRKWLDRWTVAAGEGQRSEPLAAFFYVGDKTATMSLVTGWLQSRPDDERLRNTFFATGLRLGEYPVLARWVWHDVDLAHKAERGQWLLVALEQFLNAGGKPGAGMVAELFPPDVKMRETLWEVASTAFAERHWYAQAAELGTRVYALTPDSRSEYALKIAQWELYLGNTGHARAVLRDAIDTDRGQALDAGGNAVFAALRTYYMLLPVEERPAFCEEYLRQIRSLGGGVHATLAAIVLNGLSGDEPAARRHLDELLRMRMLSGAMGEGTPDARRWIYVLSAGAQLQAWNLDALAAYWWRRALNEATAFERDDGDATNVQTEIRGRLLLVDLAIATDPQQARERVEDYLRGGPRWDAVAMEAAQLLSVSQWGAAARLYEALCRARPGDADHWRNLFVAYDSTGDRASLERTLVALLASRTPPPVGLGRVDLLTRLANVREAMGDGAGACRLLERARQETPGAQPMLIQVAQAEERAGRWEEAARAWEEALPMDPGGGARMSLAATYERLGQADKAIALLSDTPRTLPEAIRAKAAASLARLYLAAGRRDDALALATRLLQANAGSALASVSLVLADGGERAFVRDILAAGVRRTHDPQARYQLQRTLAALYALPSEDATTFARETTRLGAFARADAGLRNAFIMDRYGLAQQRKADAWLENELKREWDDSRGDLSAGENLATLYLDTSRENELRGLIGAVDRHADLPEQMLHSLATRLVQTGRGVLALPMLQRLRRRFPQNDLYTQDEARALWQAGRLAEAHDVLEVLDQMSVFRADLVGLAGKIFVELGDHARAREKFETVMRQNGAAIHFPQIALDLARIAGEEHRLVDAHRWLRVAYRNPTCVNLDPVVSYLDAAGQLSVEAARRNNFGDDFSFTILRRAQLLTAICQRLTTSGRGAGAGVWILSHVELLADAPGLVAVYRRAMAPADLPAFATLVEKVISQTDPSTPQVGRELAALYEQLAGQETATPESRLGFLLRAYELAPDDFGLALQLAATLIEQNQADRAVAVLTTFTSSDALPAERLRAQQMLSKLPRKIDPASSEG